MENEKEINGVTIKAGEGYNWTDIKEPIEIAKHLVSSDIFHEKWLTSMKDIEKKFTQYAPGQLEKDLDQNTLLNKLFLYVTRLSYNVIFNESALSYVPKDIQDEFSRENEKGTLCIYSSVLLYLLIERLKLNTTLHLIQGIYQIKFPPNTLQQRIIGKQAVGAHAYLLVNDTIVDPTIQQVGDNYYLGKSEYIVVGENLPKNISMYGWRESYEIVIKYANQYANQRGLSLNEWLLRHEDAANHTMVQSIKSGDIKLERNEECFCGSKKKYKKCCYKKVI